MNKKQTQDLTPTTYYSFRKCPLCSRNDIRITKMDNILGENFIEIIVDSNVRIRDDTKRSVYTSSSFP